jgi:holo-[acyl-carrier protein] synthase
MIIGFGIDLCDIRRIEESLVRYGERFTKRCFTDAERAKSDGRAQRAASYAKRFAAKEACAKALGTGIRSGIFWRDMGIVNTGAGPGDHRGSPEAVRLRPIYTPPHPYIPRPAAPRLLGRRAESRANV